MKPENQILFNILRIKTKIKDLGILKTSYAFL